MMAKAAREQPGKHKAHVHEGARRLQADDGRGMERERRVVRTLLVAGRGPAPELRNESARMLKGLHCRLQEIEGVRAAADSTAVLRPERTAPPQHARGASYVHYIRALAGRSAPPAPRAPLLQRTLAAAAALCCTERVSPQQYGAAACGAAAPYLPL